MAPLLLKAENKFASDVSTVTMVSKQVAFILGILKRLITPSARNHNVLKSQELEKSIVNTSRDINLKILIVIIKPRLYKDLLSCTVDKKKLKNLLT